MVADDGSALALSSTGLVLELPCVSVEAAVPTLAKMFGLDLAGIT